MIAGELKILCLQRSVQVSECITIQSLSLEHRGIQSLSLDLNWGKKNLQSSVLPLDHVAKMLQIQKGENLSRITKLLLYYTCAQVTKLSVPASHK